MALPNKKIMTAAAVSLLVLLGTSCARPTQGTARTSQRSTIKVPKVPAAIAPSTCLGVPGTQIDLATLANKTQFDNACYVALANVPLVMLFANNTITQSGKPLSLGFSVYHSQEDGYTWTDNGTAFISHPDKSIFMGMRSWRPDLSITTCLLFLPGHTGFNVISWPPS